LSTAVKMAALDALKAKFQDTLTSLGYSVYCEQPKS
jgi:hypothetical protein